MCVLTYKINLIFGNTSPAKDITLLFSIVNNELTYKIHTVSGHCSTHFNDNIKTFKTM